MTSKKTKAASGNPDEMQPGGLKDDFDGVITKAVYTAWDYDGKIDKPVLSAALTIQPDMDEEPFVQQYSAGSLDHFVPSLDGETPAPEGPYAIRVGGRDQLNNNTNWAQFLGSLKDAGFKRFDADISFCEGLHAHFVRVPQPKRSGILVEEGTRRGAATVLVVSTLLAPPLKNAFAAPVKPEGFGIGGLPKAVTNTTEERLRETVLDLVLNADGQPVKKSKVLASVLKAFNGDPDKAKAVRRAGETAFYQAGAADTLWIFDVDSSTVKAIGQED